MFEIKVSQEIKNACPVFAGAAVYAAVKNTAYCDGLWKEINTFTEDLIATSCVCIPIYEICNVFAELGTIYITDIKMIIFVCRTQ